MDDNVENEDCEEYEDEDCEVAEDKDDSPEEDEAGVGDVGGQGRLHTRQVSSTNIIKKK